VAELQLVLGCVLRVEMRRVWNPCRHQQKGGTIHDPQVSTVTLQLHQPCSLEGAKHWLDRLLWETVDVMDIFRMKGILNVSGSEAKHVLQVG
jgi:G3E family GTPase